LFVILLSARRDSRADFLSFQRLPDGGSVAWFSSVGARREGKNAFERTVRGMTRGIINAADSLEIAVHHGDEGSTVRLRGRVDIDSSPALRDQLIAILRKQSPEAVIVDLTDVSYIDGSGIATLIEGLKIARQRQTTLCLQGVQGRLVHFFQVTGISTLFEKNACGSTSSVSKVS
jgi:anti-sigma B factor antagonist